MREKLPPLHARSSSNRGYVKDIVKFKIIKDYE